MALDINSADPFPPELPEDPEETFHAGDLIDVGVVHRNPNAAKWFRKGDSSTNVPMASPQVLRVPAPLDHLPPSDTPGELPASTPFSDEIPSSARGQQFRMVRPFAKGGNGEIWEALQTTLGRIVAVKRIRRRGAEGESSIVDSHQKTIGFRQEALTTASLEHPNIVPIYELGLDEDGEPLLAMKMIRGHHWNKMIEFDFERLPVEELLVKHLPILASACQAVAFAHSRGIAHRDIKASQVMVGEFGEVLLTDWGLAVVFDEERLAQSPSGREAARFTPGIEEALSPAGTPACMAPEQTQPDARRVGAWTDLYLLGGVLYSLLTGTMPHEAQSSREAFHRAMLGEVEPPSRRAPDREVPAPLEERALRCLQAEPSDRLADVTVFVEEIQQYLSGASKRRESRALTERVIRDVTNIDDQYEAFQNCSELLMRATTLWPDNPQAVPLREYISSAYARAAMKNNDLTLAEMQARNIPNSVIREEILDEIGDHRSRVRRHAKERRQLVVAFLVLLSVMGFGFYMLKDLRVASREDALRRQVDQDQAAAAQTRAQAQKEVADALRQLALLLHQQQEVAMGLRRLLPIPDSLDTNTVAGQAVRPNFAEVSRLLTEARMLQAEENGLRDALPEQDRGLAPGELPFLDLAAPLSALLQADSATELTEALALLEKVRQEHPIDPEVHLVLGIVCHRLGLASAARESFAAAERLALEMLGEFHPTTRQAAQFRQQLSAP